MLNVGHSNAVFSLLLCLNSPFKIISMLILSKIRLIKAFESESAHFIQIFKINEECVDNFCTFFCLYLITISVWNQNFSLLSKHINENYM